MQARQHPLMLLGILLSIVVVGHTQEVAELGREASVQEHNTAPGLERIRQLLQTVSTQPEARHKLKSLGESLATAESNLPQIHAFAHKLMKSFMSDATGASGDAARSGSRFDALVASISRQIESGDENKIAMLKNLVKEAVQAEILRKGGRSGEAEDMDIPTAANDADDAGSDDMDKEAAASVDQKVSGEMSRRQNLRAAARTLEIQKAQDREKEAQEHVDMLTKQEEEQQKKVAQFTLEEEKLREEAAQAHAAASSPSLAARIAREASNDAMKLARKVEQVEEDVNAVKSEASDALRKTLEKDAAAKTAHEKKLAGEDGLETAKESVAGMGKVAQSSMDKVHKQLARNIRQLNEAIEDKETAERKVRQAEQQDAEATSSEEKEAAEAKLSAAKAALSQAEAQVEMDEKAKATEVTQAGSKKMKQSLQVATAEAGLKNAELTLSNDKLAANKAEQEAADAQQAASQSSIKATAAMTKLQSMRAEAQAAAHKSMEARRMESPTVANEVATKKAIAVASTNFVKRQAAAKVLMIQKKKKAAMEELSVIRVVASRLAAEGTDTQDNVDAPVDADADAPNDAK
jgi:hypothetical protein